MIGMMFSQAWFPSVMHDFCKILFRHDPKIPARQIPARARQIPARALQIPALRFSKIRQNQ